MPVQCCVWKCRSSRSSSGVKFFRFPIPGPSLSVLKNDRILKWKSVLGYKENFSPYGKRICSLHFLSGKPARITDSSNPDWIPSTNLHTNSSEESDNSESRSTYDSSSSNSNVSKGDVSMALDSSSYRKNSGGHSDSSDECRKDDVSSSSSDEEELNSSDESLKSTSDKKSLKSTSSSSDTSYDSSSYRKPSSLKKNSEGHSDSLDKCRKNEASSSSSDKKESNSTDESPKATSRSSDPTPEDAPMDEDVPHSSKDQKFKDAATSTNCCDSNVDCDMVKKYQTELIRLQARVDFLDRELKLHQRGFEFISVSNQKCLYFTGITDFSTVRKIFEYLEPNMTDPFCHLTTRQVFVMTLTKLRLNTQFKSLAYDYDVSATTISKYFHMTLDVMDTCLQHALKVPSREVLLRHTPAKFKQRFGNSRVFVVDCFEVRSESPSDPKAKVKHFSNYKKAITTKFMIAVCPDGNISFISSGYGGRCSDKKIVTESGFLDILMPGDVVLADKGFDIRDLVESKGATLNIPSFLKSKTQFKPAEIEENKQITSLRIHVERCIGTLRLKFHVLSQIITMDSLVRFEDGKNVVDLITKVCCILYNFNPSIIPE